MTNQRQNTRDPWTAPARTLEQAGPDSTGPASSTRDTTARDSTDANRPADHGAVYRSAAHDSAIDEPDARQPVADRTADERGADERITEQAAGDGESLDAVDGPDPSGHADVDHVDPVHAVGVASVQDADADADTVDRDAFKSPAVAAQSDAPTDAPDEAYGIDERAEVVGGEMPTVTAPMDDAASPDVTRSDVTRAGEMLPGDLPEAPGLALFDGETTKQFRDRWHELQLRFVDDPHAVEVQAVALVDEVVTALGRAVEQQRTALHDWQSGQAVAAHSGDTEQMRVSVRRYRTFLEHLLGV